MPLHPPSGSRATPIPSDAPAGFATASTLLRHARGLDKAGSVPIAKRLGLVERYHTEDNSKSSRDSMVERDRSHKHPIFKKPKVRCEEPLGPTVHVRDVKTVAELEESKGSEAIVSKTKKPPKRKSKDGGGQTKIKKSKITKPGSIKITDKSKKMALAHEEGGNTGVEADKAPISTQDSDKLASEEFRELCAEKALPMRRHWTPVKDTERAPECLEEPNTGTLMPLSENKSINNAPPQARFGQLLGDFGFALKDPSPTTHVETSSFSESHMVIKKRKIELVEGVPAPPPVEKPTRTKSSKKKPQTVTGKATAPFVPSESEGTTSLLQYFDTAVRGVQGDSGRNNQGSESSVPVVGKSQVRKTLRPKPLAAKEKKQTLAPLLSPDSAMKNAHNQELIFGTSSQLAREESPAILRDLQQALKASDSVASVENPDSSQPVAKFKPYNSLALTNGKNLWSVSSRDNAGSLLEIEVVDLSVTPKSGKHTTGRPSVVGEPDAARIEEYLRNNEQIESEQVRVLPALGLVATPILQKQQQLHHVKEREPVLEAGSELAIPRSVAEVGLRKRPKSHSPVKQIPKPDQMPNYEGFTNADLRKAVAKYGFKPIKRRESMIALLKECWKRKMELQEALVDNAVVEYAPESAIKSALIETNKDHAAAAAPAKKRVRPKKEATTGEKLNASVEKPSSKKARGRPRKDSSATSPPKRKARKATLPQAQDVGAVTAGDEIYDSSPPIPSPPRRRSPPKSPKQLPLDEPAAPSADDSTTSIERDQSFLLSQMTKAITTFPPTHDPKNLTFYEKMLMYEPVMLEDLTIWLNTTGLGMVGEDREVSPLEVKAWCEARSVCCLWRENLRGGARSRW